MGGKIGKSSKTYSVSDQTGKDTDDEDKFAVAASYKAQNGQDAEEKTKKEENTIENFEDILDQIGAFGPWQILIFCLISVADIHGAFAILSPVFTGSAPSWYCNQYEGISGNVSRNESTETCTYNDKECTEIIFDGDFTSIVSKWSLVCSLDYVSDLVTSLQMMGVMIGAAVGGQLSDSIGRKKTYFLVFLFMIVAACGSAAATHWQVYILCRVLVGIGFGGLMVVACVYPMEFVGRKWRVFCGTIGFWALGTVLLALFAYLIRDWRYLTLLLSISGLIFFPTWWLIPESPRWLISKMRYEEAHAILEKIATKNGRTYPSLETLMHLKEAEMMKEKTVKKYTYLDLVRTPLYFKQTAIVVLAWFTVFLMYYEISYNLKHLSGDRYINMVLSGIVDLIAMLTVIVILNWLGRRKGLLFYLTIAIISLVTILIIIVKGKKESLGTVILVCALVGKSVALSGTYAIQIFTSELFPTVIRNVGVGAGSIAARIGGIVAPQLVYLGTINTVAPYIICSVLSAIVIPMMFLLPETVGKPLRDQGIDEMKEKLTPEEDNTRSDKPV